MDNDTTEQDSGGADFLSEDDDMVKRMDDFFGDTPEAPAEPEPEPVEKDPSAQSDDELEDFYAKADELDDPDAAPKPPEATEEAPAETPEAEDAAEPEPKAEESTEEPKAKEQDGTPKIDPKADPFDAETMELIKEMSSDPHAGIKFAKLRGELKEMKAAVAQFEEGVMATPEMMEVKARAERVSELEVALNEAHERLSMVDFQSTPDYQQEIQAPFMNMMNDAKAIEESRGMPEGAIMNAIAATDPSRQEQAIQEIMENYNVSRREELRMYQMADASLNLRAREQELQRSATDRLSAYQERQQAQQAYQSEQEKAVYRKTLHDTFKQYEGSVNSFLDDEGKSNEEWQEAIKQSENLDFRDPELQAIGAYALAAAPALAKENRELASEVSKLKVLLNRHKAATPPAPNSTATATPTSKPNPNVDTELSLADSLGRRMAAAGL
jgi:hypothetical protein